MIGSTIIDYHELLIVSTTIDLLISTMAHNANGQWFIAVDNNLIIMVKNGP